ncbi:MAG: hypothetical protein AB7V04_09375 [Desulfomonilaceae bacterium]
MNTLKIITLAMIVVASIVMAPYSSPADGIVVQEFDRNACYSTCGCDARGMEAACFSCRQECDRKFWAAFDRETSEDKVGSIDDDQN